MGPHFPSWDEESVMPCQNYQVGQRRQAHFLEVVYKLTLALVVDNEDNYDELTMR